MVNRDTRSWREERITVVWEGWAGHVSASDGYKYHCTPASQRFRFVHVCLFAHAVVPERCRQEDNTYLKLPVLTLVELLLWLLLPCPVFSCLY